MVAHFVLMLFVHWLAEESIAWIKMTGRMSYVDLAWPWGLVTLGLQPLLSPAPDQVPSWLGWNVGYLWRSMHAVVMKVNLIVWMTRTNWWFGCIGQIKCTDWPMQHDYRPHHPIKFWCPKLASWSYKLINASKSKTSIPKNMFRLGWTGGPWLQLPTPLLVSGSSSVSSLTF